MPEFKIQLTSKEIVLLKMRFDCAEDEIPRRIGPLLQGLLLDNLSYASRFKQQMAEYQTRVAAVEAVMTKATIDESTASRDELFALKTKLDWQRCEALELQGRVKAIEAELTKPSQSEQDRITSKLEKYHQTADHIDNLEANITRSFEDLSSIVKALQARCTELEAQQKTMAESQQQLKSENKRNEQVILELMELIEQTKVLETKASC